MKKRPAITAGVLAALAIVVAICALWRREPIYQGKTLSRWLIEANSGSWPRKSRVPADEAIRQIGTNAFPFIAKQLRSHHSALKCRLLGLYYKQSLIRLNIITTQNDHHSWAMAALFAFGSEARTLVPEVANALKDMDPYFRPNFQQWLQELGPDADAAVPALIALLEDKKNPTRQTVAQTLGYISVQRRREVIPVLAACSQDTNDPNGMVRFWAAEALKQLGQPQPTNAAKTP